MDSKPKSKKEVREIVENKILRKPSEQTREMKHRLPEVIKNSSKPLKLISEEIGIHYQTLTNYAQGKRTPRNSDTETWDKLASYFGVSTAFLMGLDETAKEELNLDEIAALLSRHIKELLEREVRTLKERRTLFSATSVSQLISLNDIFESFVFDERSKTNCVLYMSDIITQLLGLTISLVDCKSNQSADSPMVLLEENVKLNERTLLKVGAVTTSIHRYIDHLNNLTIIDLVGSEKAEEVLEVEGLSLELKKLDRELSDKIKDFEEQ